MAHLFNSGHAVVTQDPNLETTLQANPRMRIAVLDDGSQAWKYVDSNTAGSKWVELSTDEILAGVGITDNAGAFDLGDPAINQDIVWDLIPITVGRDLRKISITNDTDGNSIEFTQESVDISTERVSANLTGSATFNTVAQFAINQSATGSSEPGDVSTSDGLYVNANAILLNARNLMQVRPGNDVIDSSQIGFALVKVDGTGTTEWVEVATAVQGALADSALQSVVGGTNVTVDNTDPQNPIINVSGLGGSLLPTQIAFGDATGQITGSNLLTWSDDDEELSLMGGLLMNGFSIANADQVAGSQGIFNNLSVTDQATLFNVRISKSVDPSIEFDNNNAGVISRLFVDDVGGRIKFLDNTVGGTENTLAYLSDISGGGLAGTIGDNQIAFGNASGEIEGSSELEFDGTQMVLRGSSTDRFIRMAESPAQFNGGFIQYEGSTNKMHIGVHSAGDADPLNDTKVLTVQRSDGFVGLNTETPNFEFDMEGTFRNEGARISPTFTDFTNRVSLVNPSFGGTRLGDSELQTPNIDIGTALNFKTTGQVTQWAAFSNAVGNTLTWRHVQNPTALFSIQNDAASSTRGVTDAESTIGLVTNYSNGDSQVFDLFNQEYIANGSVLAQAQGINMIAGNGDHRKFGIYRSDTGLTNIRTIMEVSEAGSGDQAEFFQPVKGVDALNSDEFATLGQIPTTFIDTLVEGDGIGIDNTDPSNPVVSFTKENLPIIETESGRTNEILGAVIRNTGGVWDYINDVGHVTTGFNSISSDTEGTITVTYDKTFNKVINLNATVDETYAEDEVFVGASVGFSSATIKLFKRLVIADFISYNGTSFVSLNNEFTIDSYSSGVLTVSHRDLGNTFDCQITDRDTSAYINRIGSVGTSTMEVKFYNFDGSQYTGVPNTDMKFFLKRTGKIQLNNTESAIPISNIWITGVMQI